MTHIDKLAQLEKALTAGNPKAIAAVATEAKREETARALLKDRHVRETFGTDEAEVVRYLENLATKPIEQPKRRRTRSPEATKQQAERRASEIMTKRPIGPAATWPKGVLEALMGRGEPPAPHPWDIDFMDAEAVRNVALWKLAFAPGAPRDEILRLLQDPNARTIANLHVAFEHRMAETLIANAANEPEVDGKLVANLLTFKEQGRPFGLKELAASVSVNHPNQLLGKLANGKRRYPHFHHEWEQYQAEIRDRASLRRKKKN